MPRAEKLHAQTVGQGGRSSLQRVTYQLEGETSPFTYDLYSLRASAGVLPLDDDGYVYLIEEFAPGAGNWLLGLARGGIDAGESPMQAAQRELKEEAGLMCGQLVPLWSGYPAANASDWHVHLFAGLGVASVERTGGDEHGEVRVRKVKLAHAVAMVQRGDVPTALTALAIGLLAARQDLRVAQEHE